MLARTKANFTLPPTANGAANVSGYMLWCPDFHNVTVNTPGNLFCYLSSDPGIAPRNDAVTQYGKFGAQSAILGNNSAFNITDPAGNLVASSVVADARVLSACMTITFLGKMIDSAGELCFLQNVPIAELIGNADNACLSVSQLFNYAASKRRLGVETIESIYRLNLESSDKFRDSTLKPLIISPGGRTIQDDTSETFAPRVFGYAWRGVAPDAIISFDFIKNIEWRPEAVSGFSQVPIVNMGPSLAAQVMAGADRLARSNPEVWQHVKGAAAGLGARMVRAAFAGPSHQQLL